jgi:hypothetical protein
VGILVGEFHRLQSILAGVAQADAEEYRLASVLPRESATPLSHRRLPR